MGFIDYDAASFEADKDKKIDKSNDGEPIYADSTEIRPDSGGNNSNSNNQSDDSDSQDETNAVRNRTAEKLVENIPEKPDTPSERLTELKKAKPVSKAYAKPKSENCNIKDFPRELMNEVRHLFPNATNNQDALSAFVLAHLDEYISVSETVDALVKDYNKTDPVVSVDERLHNLERQVSILVKGLTGLELGLSYIIYDRLGYRNNQPKDARSADMLESNRSGAVTDIVTRMREQANQMRKEENIKNGRPIR